MYYVNPEPFINDKEKTIYLAKTQSGPGGHVMGFLTVYKPVGNETWSTICNDKAFDALKLLETAEGK